MRKRSPHQKGRRPWSIAKERLRAVKPPPEPGMFLTAKVKQDYLYAETYTEIGKRVNLKFKYVGEVMDPDTGKWTGTYNYKLEEGFDENYSENDG